MTVSGLKVKAEVMEVDEVNQGKFVVKQNNQGQSSRGVLLTCNYSLIVHQPFLIYSVFPVHKTPMFGSVSRMVC